MSELGPHLGLETIINTINTNDYILIAISGKVYRLPATAIITPEKVNYLQTDDSIMVEVNGALKRISASYIMRPLGYRGPALTTTNPGTPPPGDWYIANESGTFTNFGNQTANYLDIFIFDGASWNRYPNSGKIFRTFTDTNPETLASPGTDKIITGTFNNRLWTKQPDGEIRYLKYDDGNWYGVEWDITVSSPDVKRIGNFDLHRTLPLHNKIYTCILKDDGSEAYKLDPTNWGLRDDGVTAANTDGTDGQVMTYYPEYYWKFEQEGNYRRLKFSEHPLSGFSYQQPVYISAYEATVDRTNGVLASVKNLTTQFRGGNNDSTLDGTDTSQLSMPATSITRTNFRTYARARGTGWEMYFYQMHRTMAWFFMVEFATRNSQKAVNAALDSNGFRQGGLGIGVTTLPGYDWSTFNGYYPIISIGTSDGLASGTGEIDYTLPASFPNGPDTMKVNRYRGIEMPFGHIWKNADQVNVRMAANDDADPTTKVYISDDPALWNDSNYDGFELQGEMPRVNGYITEMIPFNIMPLQVGGGSSTYWCDYSYQANIPADGIGASLRTVLFGGHATYGGSAGLGCSYADDAPSSSGAAVGSRLCFIPA